MKHTFFCQDCHHTFQAPGTKQTSTSSVFGPTWRYVANCPQCHQSTPEYKPMSLTKSRSSSSSPSTPSCPTGTCPFAQ